MLANLQKQQAVKWLKFTSFYTSTNNFCMLKKVVQISYKNELKYKSC